MKYYLFLFVFIIYGCATTNVNSNLPPLPKTEYNGPDLEWNSEDYKIEQMVKLSETFFMITAPENENILLNLYKEDGSLIATLYEGKGGILMTSFAKFIEDYNAELSPGNYLLILYGEKGKTLFRLKTV